MHIRVKVNADYYELEMSFSFHDIASFQVIQKQWHTKAKTRNAMLENEKR